MRLTRAASYALHAMVHIASQQSNEPLASHEIAQARNIPERFLLKVLKPLVGAGILTSVKGPRGGYRLARPAAQVSMLEVIEAVEGPIRGQVSFHPDNGSPDLDRQLDQICAQAAEQTRRHFQAIRLSQLAQM
jgi:Rrf2 family protein